MLPQHHNQQQQIQPQGENHTLYLQNLNDKIKIDTLKKSLYLLFSAYGDVIDVHIRNGRKYRGQAWIIFKVSTHCSHALTKLQNIVFYGKNLKISISKTKSDIIAKADGTYGNKANEKLLKLAKELEGTMIDDNNSNIDNGSGGIDGSDVGANGLATGQKRKLVDDLTAGNNDPIIDRNDKDKGRQRFRISDEPTITIFACNFPIESTKEQINQFFDKKPKEIFFLDQKNNESKHLYNELNINNHTLPIWIVTFYSVSDAQDAIDTKGKFKFSDELKIKLTFCYDSEPLAGNVNVQLGAAQ